MAASSQIERSSSRFALNSPVPHDRLTFARGEFEGIVKHEDVFRSMLLGAGLNDPQRRFGMLTAGLITSQTPVATADRLVYKSPFDTVSTSKNKHSAEIRTSEPGFAELVGIHPQMNFLEYGFKKAGLIQPGDFDDLKEMIDQTGYPLRIVMCNPEMLEEENKGLHKFVEATRDGRHASPNEGIRGMLSNWGVGEVFDITKYSGTLHLYLLKGGKQIGSEDWQVQSGDKPDIYKLAIRRPSNPKS